MNYPKKLPMWRILALLLLIGLALPAFSADKPLPVLGPNARVSLVTQWPGEEVYFAFGHSALRVVDKAQDIDILFNYGVVSAEGGIDDSLFLARFVYGQLDYKMAVEPYELMRDYDLRVQNRIWNEQVLDLSQDQINRLFVFLANNARPENCVYRYDFILDNCSTRIPLAFDKALGNEITLSPDPAVAKGKSFHAMIDEFVVNRPLFDFAFYLVLGRAADRVVSAREATFLPFYLSEALNRATVTRDGAEHPLVKSSGRLSDPLNPTNHDSPLLNPAFVLWPLMALVLAWTVRGFVWQGRKSVAKDRWAGRLADWLLFFIIGIMGVLVWFLTFVSTHAAVKENLNVLWLQPLWLVAAFFALLARRPRCLQWFWLAGGLLALIPLISWPIWPQKMHPTMIPLMMLIICRAWWHARDLLMALAGRISGHSIKKQQL